MSSVSGGDRARRPYRLGVRAQHQEATRRRITQAAVELHGSIGPARTTVSAVAARAGVERLTVYRHFPNQKSLFAACSQHYRTDHPAPDLSVPMARPEPARRLESVLLAMYRYYRDTSAMMAALHRDAETAPLIAEYLGGFWSKVAGLAEHLVDGFDVSASERPALRAAIGHALDFSTWRSLAEGQMLDDDRAAALAARMILGVLVPQLRSRHA